MPRKPGDDDDLGESFDDLYREAEEEMRKARESLNKMRPGKDRTDEPDRSRASRLRPSQQGYHEEGLDEPGEDRPRKGCEALDDRSEDPERQERLGRQLECRYMAELLENHQIHVMRPTEGSAAYQEALEDYRRLKRDYDRLCAESTGHEMEGAIKRGARASGTRPASATPLVGEALAQHREKRAQPGYSPSTAQEYNTDARDLDEWAFQEELAPPGSSDHNRARQGREGIEGVYEGLGSAAHDAPTGGAPNYPDSDDSPNPKGIKKLKEAYKRGHLGRQSGSPQAPSGTRPSSTVPLVGEKLAQHRERRAGDGYDPQSEQQFNTDAKDLEEWAFQEKLAIPDTSDHTRAVQRKQAILDRYQNLGRKALQSGEATRNYPQTEDPKHRKGVDKLKEAFKAGYRQNQ